MFNVQGMAYKRREWMVTMPHLWTVVSRNMFLTFKSKRVGRKQRILYFINLTFFIYKIKKLCLTLFSVYMYRITRERYSIFLSVIVKSTPYFPVFSVGRNEHKFVICLRVKVFTCNILIGYSGVHPESRLKHDYLTKIGTLFFMDFHSD